jgi:glutathione S-transferase
MLRLYDYPRSGNAYKARLLLHLLGTPYERIELDIARGETRTPDFLSKNPSGRIPLLETGDGRLLAESNAILWYLAEGTAYLPTEPFDRALALRWMFFEQYEHEPNIATVRAWHLFGMIEEKRALLEEKYRRGYDALAVMEKHLAAHRFFVGERYSIADISLYAYTHVAGEGRYDLARFPAVRAWLDRVRAQPGHVAIDDLCGPAPSATPPSTSHYVHGTHPEEQHRLSLLNDLLNGLSLRELRLAPGERVLDVGSGLAQLTRAMGRAVGAGRVLGVERSAEQLNEARRLSRDAGEENLCELRQGDARHLPLQEEEWGTFDVAHARFLLEHVPWPLEVVKEIVRAVRPGGRIVLMDDDHENLRLAPEPPGFARLYRALLGTYERHGNDPHVGRRLASLLEEAGATPVRCQLLPIATGALSAELALYVENLIGNFVGAREAMIGPGGLEARELEEGVEAIRAWGKRCDAVFWYALPWVEGVRRG